MLLPKMKEKESRPALSAVQVRCTAPASKMAAEMKSHTMNSVTPMAYSTCCTTVWLSRSVCNRLSRFWNTCTHACRSQPAHACMWVRSMRAGARCCGGPARMQGPHACARTCSTLATISSRVALLSQLRSKSSQAASMCLRPACNAASRTSDSSTASPEFSRRRFQKM